MTLLRRVQRASCCSLFALLVACGGGGGGGTGGAQAGSQVSFDPAVLTFTMPADGQSADGRKWLPVTATVPNLAGARAYVVIVQDQAIFENEPVEITAVGGDQYRALLPMRISMPAGSYEGDITILICYDTACANRHPGSGAKLPYRITVTPALAITLQVNGAAVATQAGQPMVVNDGDAVTLTSSQPVQWRLGMGGGYASGATTTDTTWSATVRNGTSPRGVGTLDVYADTLTDPQAEVVTHFSVQP